ncbi:App1 family protein [Pontibacter cellulosilyticus]|uniref:DUF2183 domain-containing protein n=1 Tax=Pontibacter cellulosilyticus TaxID=1720253 RepID=A0A923SP67_9BACT|nr:phosphatase domain-containing protein [Pontibacter cellulosilyticus]MBC5993865.1 DUF2183 domain-containing protein [Pontibacter cellulosilyticus]
MMNRLYEAFVRLEQEVDAGREKIKEDLHLLRPIQILPFYGYGSEIYVYLKGRVIEKDKKQDDKQEANSGEQLLSMVRRFGLSAIPHVKVRASFAGMQQEVETNKEGYFEIEFTPDKPIDYQEAGYCMKLELLERKTGKDELEAEGRLFVPEQDARFGIISDVDDTVMISGMASITGQLKHSLFEDAQERSPFPGIASLLQVLKGSNNPLYYVSSSQWSMYSFLVSFMEAQDIPKGPLFLRDFGDNLEQNHKHRIKYNQICGILRTYSNLKFILIGDSGKNDPEVYQQVVQDYPEQVLCVYIRDVTDDGRAREVEEICNKVEAMGVDMLLVQNSAKAAEHAFRHGWITLPQLQQVQKNQQQQKEK